MNFLEKLADFQYKHAVSVLIFTLIFTGIIAFGFANVSMESDLNKMSPQDLEIYQLADKITDVFGGQDATFVLVKLEDGDKTSVSDVRDPKVMKFLLELQEKLDDEDLVESATSVGLILQKIGLTSSKLDYMTLDQVKSVLSNIPASNNFFNKDYSSTMVMISSDLGGGEEKIKDFSNKISEILDTVSKPEGVKVYVTGTPQIRVMILDLLVKDAIYTLSLAIIITLLMLIFTQKSFSKAILIVLPLIFGLALTLGIMGLLNIKLSVATVGIGAMILGLGVEYGVFIISRYHEERKDKSSQEALKIVVKEVGTSVIGSGTTTIAGFLALGLSTIPMLRDLGFSLALGIAAALLAALFVNPAFIILEEKLEERVVEKMHNRIVKIKEHHTRRKKLDGKSNK